MINKFGRYMDVVVAYLKVLFIIFHGGTAGNH
jgi:hypothetical protein